MGNRLTKTTGASTDTYAYSGTSNRIASITPASGPVRNFVFDANGSTTNDAVNAYAYDVRGRIVQATAPRGVTDCLCRCGVQAPVLTSMFTLLPRRDSMVA